MMNFAQLMTRAILTLPDNILTLMAGSKPLEIDGRKLNLRMHFIGAQAAKGPSLTSFTPEQARVAARTAFAITNAPREGGILVRDDAIKSKDGADIKIRHYRPKNKNDAILPAILYFHMGGWVIGDLETCDQFCSLLSARVNAHVMSVDYRLAPEHKFPTAMEDAFTAYLWLRDHAGQINIDANHIAVGGDSAGGCMTAVLCQEMKRRGQPQPKLQLMIYPATDFTNEHGSMQSCGECQPLTTDVMQWFGQHWLNNDNERSNPLASPMLGDITSDLAPAIIITAGFDPLRDQGKAYADRLQQEGVRVLYHCEDSLAHAFTAYAGLVPAARDANEAIARHVKEMIG